MTKHATSCNPAHFRRLSRRGFLSVGALAGAGLTLPQLLRLQNAQAELKQYENFEGTAKSIIHIYLPGGMAHQESWDPKPYSPIEYRGELKHTKTNVNGMLFGQTMKKMSQCADKVTVINSMTHGEAAHERGTHNMFTGYRPSPAIQYPSIGSILSYELGSRNNLPPYVCIPNQPNEFAGTGYLSSSYAPFSLGSDPASKGFRVRDLNTYAGIDESRFATRRSALEAVNDYFRSREKSDQVAAMDSFYQQAFDLMGSKEAREAFDLEKEDPKLRDAYGRNQAGARILMARRLVEAGVRLVNLTYGGWDMHRSIKTSFERTMPPLDQALAALIKDLGDRGQLDETLIMVSSEFGRTPKINKDSGGITGQKYSV